MILLDFVLILCQDNLHFIGMTASYHSRKAAPCMIRLRKLADTPLLEITQPTLISGIRRDRTDLDITEQSIFLSFRFVLPAPANPHGLACGNTGRCFFLKALYAKIRIKATS